MSKTFDEIMESLNHFIELEKGKREGKQTRFEQFREQTATIDGLRKWVITKIDPAYWCSFCTLVDDECDFGVDCDDGIKAYLEGEEDAG